MISNYINKTFSLLFSERKKAFFEKLTLYIAVFAFLIHCTFVILVNVGWLSQNAYDESGIMPNLLSAIYTPFSIILLYEIYLLIYYLPKSITIYLGKQYEIIALIFIRKIFNNLASLSSGTEPFNSQDINYLLLYFGGLMLLMLLIFCFYKLNGNKQRSDTEYKCSNKELNFILIKKVLAIVLMIVFIFLFIGSFSEVLSFNSITVNSIVDLVKNMSFTFFEVFFTALILTEVLLLLFTLNLSDNFSKVIRNSGFIISTILLKLSFKAEGTENIVIILIAVAFGVAILAVHKLYMKKLWSA